MNTPLKEQLETVRILSGKVVKEIVTVYADGQPFSIAGAYESRARGLGYGIGSMCMDEPRALSKTADYIAKWRNIPICDYPKMEGVVLCEDGRDGKEAHIVILADKL
jgi:hypothetical protein